MPKDTEIERKFLVRNVPPDLAKYPHYLIEQGYLVIGDDAEARLRRITRGRSHQHILTIKRSAPQGRTEIEIPLPPAHFARLWPLTKGQRLQKTRYEIPLPRRLTLELDVYRGPLRGLVTAEVEFPSTAASKSFIPPPLLGQDISHFKPLSNKSLARQGLPQGYPRPTQTPSPATPTLKRRSQPLP